jgi:CDP-diacylglycerol--serine O-phosphatidyltransferase
VSTMKTSTEGTGSARFRKSIYLLPNLLTASNLVLGILAIVASLNDALALSLSEQGKTPPFVWPARFILMAIFLDFMDGRVARATKTTSRFGVEFDSMADLISFGVAPSLLIYLSVLRYLDFWGISIMVLYVVCAAVRLARFNVQANVEEKDHFTGLPSPAAAGLLASYALLSRWEGWYAKGAMVNQVMGWYVKNIATVERIVIPSLTVLVALVMVSTIRYPSLKGLNRETVKPWTLAVIVLFFFWIVYAFELTAFLLLASYLLWGVTRMFGRGADRLRGRKEAH